MRSSDLLRLEESLRSFAAAPTFQVPSSGGLTDDELAEVHALAGPGELVSTAFGRVRVPDED